MAGGTRDSSLTRVQPFFGALLARDASGRSWLSALLEATPAGRRRLGTVLEDPGSLFTTLAVPAVSGRLGCFEYPAAPPRELLAWFVDHPDQLEWPAHAQLSPETVRLRRALLCDDPPGSQPRAQERARELMVTRSLASREWWRFEGVSRLDCVLMSDRLVVTVEGKRSEPLAASTDWYPKRSQLVRTLEAAKGLADGKQWASVLISETPVVPEGTSEHLERILPDSAPHLNPSEREELHAAYLGNLTWAAACDAVGLPFESLPDTTAGLRPQRMAR
jgi:hypothetical protein